MVLGGGVWLRYAQFIGLPGRASLPRRLLGVCLARRSGTCVAVSGTVSTIGSVRGTLMSVHSSPLYLTGPIYWAVIQDVVHKDKGRGSVGGAMHGTANISGIIGPLCHRFLSFEFSGKYMTMRSIWLVLSLSFQACYGLRHLLVK